MKEGKNSFVFCFFFPVLAEEEPFTLQRDVCNIVNITLALTNYLLLEIFYMNQCTDYWQLNILQHPK